VLSTQKLEHLAEQFVQSNAATLFYSEPELLRQDPLVCQQRHQQQQVTDTPVGQCRPGPEVDEVVEQCVLNVIP